MRKRAVRSGLQLILCALSVIIVISFYHRGVADALSLSYQAEAGFYQFGIVLAAALGGYGVVRTVLGLLLPGNHHDAGVRLFPSFLLIIAVVSLFFYLLSLYFDAPSNTPRERLRPGETITI